MKRPASENYLVYSLWEAFSYESVKALKSWMACQCICESVWKVLLIPL
jgi:hypothetical protein